MRLFLAFGFAFSAAIAAAPPHGGVASSGAITRTGALGGPAAANGAMSHPLGGFPSSGSRNFRGVAKPAAPRVYPYGYAWYAPSYYSPGYFAGGDDSYYGAAAPQVASDGPSPAPQPVIINEYFGTQPLGPDAAPQVAAIDPQQTAGDPIGAPQDYYLIAYRNHAIYSALAYWVEDKTLHYVTTQNTHNQASLDLIDLDLTKSLNQSRAIPFSLPGR